MYKIAKYRQEELLSKLRCNKDKEKQIWNWMKQDYINLQEFRFLIENLEICKVVETKVVIRVKKEDK